MDASLRRSTEPSDAEDRRAESLDDRAGAFRAGGGDPVRQFIRIETRHAKPLELFEDITLPGRDAAGEHHSFH